MIDHHLKTSLSKLETNPILETSDHLGLNLPFQVPNAQLMHQLSSLFEFLQPCTDAICKEHFSRAETFHTFRSTGRAE